MMRDRAPRRDLSVISLSLPTSTLGPLPSTAFPCLLWDHDGKFPAHQRDAVVRALVLGCCRYAVCGGLDCAAWENVFDEACAEADCTEQNVMTTAHPGEAVSEVAFFFASCTNFADHDFAELVVVHVEHGPLAREVDLAVAAELAARSES